MEEGVLGLITARGGSKGIPRKNLKLLAGRPLLDYTIDAALNAQALDRIIISTDDEEIGRHAVSLGVEMPFVRPADLAMDSSRHIDVVRHALEYMINEGVKYKYVVLLQPTSPFRTSQDIDSCVFKARETKADSVFAVVPQSADPGGIYILDGDKASPFLNTTQQRAGTGNRQTRVPLYSVCGSVYVSLVEVVLRRNSLMGENLRAVVVSDLHGWEIDNAFDMQVAEALIYYRGCRRES